MDDDRIDFLDAGMKKATEFVRHFDTQTNTVVGISSAIFIFSATRLVGASEISYVFLSLATFSGLSALTALYAIHPPKFMRKRGQEESLIYNGSAVRYTTPDEYYDAIISKTQTPDDIVKQMSLEIYNLYRYYYRPKRKLFKISRLLLIVGITLALVSLLLGL
jgi:hypothetical protein